MAIRYKRLSDLTREEPSSIDWQLFGRRTSPTRRGFLSGLASFSALVGTEVVFSHFLPSGLIPIALAEEGSPLTLPGKDPGLVILNDLPLNAETPAHLLDDKTTPSDRFFVRNNGVPPTEIDASTWQLKIDGESVSRTISLSLDDLKTQFEHRSYELTLECGGNGRNEFSPAARGNQWGTGAVACAKWTGVRLRDVLALAEVKDDAVYIGYHGADTHLSGNPQAVVISRGVPIDKAMEDETLLAWALNDQDIPMLHGYPLRLVVGGWPASTSGKWLTGISVRNRVHDGAKMGGYSYRVPCEPVPPGSDVPEDEMCIIESMPVKSLLTYPKSGVKHPLGKKLAVRGHAWAGDDSVGKVDVSIDFGQSWQTCALSSAINRHAWQHFSAELSFPKKGYYEVWARATDDQGRAQPMVVPGWNPKGYLNNACHRIAVQVG